MLTVHFLDTDCFEFSARDRTVILRAADQAEALVRVHLPLAEHLHLLVEGSSDVLETGDNAYTVAPHLIRWWADPERDVAGVASAHLIKAVCHEAYHAARLRRLGDEAGSLSWVVIAIGEGLATVFARDVAAAEEPWGEYDAAIVEQWADELFRQPVEASTAANWKFRHPDGREWICYRVGSWIIDRVRENTGRSATDLVWAPAAEIAAMLPAGNPWEELY